MSHQNWEYKEEKTTVKEPLFDDNGNIVLNEDGSEAQSSRDEKTIVKDKPDIRLVAAENFRIDPAADWSDPVGSSPFVIEVIPMYIHDVLERMTEIDPKTEEPKWKSLKIGELLEASKKSEFDSTRQTRQGKRQDPLADRVNDIPEYTPVFIHTNIIRMNGQNWLFSTAGTLHILTDPQPL